MARAGSGRVGKSIKNKVDDETYYKTIMEYGYDQNSYQHSGHKRRSEKSWNKKGEWEVSTKQGVEDISDEPRYE